MAPTVTVLDPVGLNIGIFITRTNGHVAGIGMDVNLSEHRLFTSGWGEVAYGLFVSPRE